MRGYCATRGKSLKEFRFGMLSIFHAFSSSCMPVSTIRQPSLTIRLALLTIGAGCLLNGLGAEKPMRLSTKPMRSPRPAVPSADFIAALVERRPCRLPLRKRRKWQAGSRAETG